MSRSPHGGERCHRGDSRSERTDACRQEVEVVRQGCADVRAHYPACVRHQQVPLSPRVAQCADVSHSGLKYFKEVLVVRFRLRLSQYVHNEYLKGVNFYKAINLGSEKIDNACALHSPLSQTLCP